MGSWHGFSFLISNEFSPRILSDGLFSGKQ